MWFLTISDSQLYICFCSFICNRVVCEENMYTFGESCYRFKTDETTFTTANTNCEASGFHLVYIETSQEQDFLASTADTVTPEQEYWIGIEKNDAGENVWMDGSAISFSNFGKIKDKDDYCFRMRKEDKDHVWEDHQCDHDHYGFICESEGGECGVIVLLTKQTRICWPK